MDTTTKQEACYGFFNILCVVYTCHCRSRARPTQVLAHRLYCRFTEDLHRTFQMRHHRAVRDGARLHEVMYNCAQRHMLVVSCGSRTDSRFAKANGVAIYRTINGAARIATVLPDNRGCAQKLAFLRNVLLIVC
jgi:hypothetical protein